MWWRSIFYWLGLSRQTRVQIRMPELHITVQGEPRKVRHMISVITLALEDSDSTSQQLLGRGSNDTGPMMVRPTDLDEMDSPYTLPIEPRRVGAHRFDSADAPMVRPVFEDYAEAASLEPTPVDPPDPERTSVEVSPLHSGDSVG